MGRAGRPLGTEEGVPAARLGEDAKVVTSYIDERGGEVFIHSRGAIYSAEVSIGSFSLGEYGDDVYPGDAALEEIESQVIDHIERSLRENGTAGDTEIEVTFTSSRQIDVDAFDEEEVGGVVEISELSPPDRDRESVLYQLRESKLGADILIEAIREKERSGAELSADDKLDLEAERRGVQLGAFTGGVRVVLHELSGEEAEDAWRLLQDRQRNSRLRHYTRDQVETARRIFAEESEQNRAAQKIVSERTDWDSLSPEEQQEAKDSVRQELESAEHCANLDHLAGHYTTGEFSDSLGPHLEHLSDAEQEVCRQKARQVIEHHPGLELRGKYDSISRVET